MPQTSTNGLKRSLIARHLEAEDYLHEKLDPEDKLKEATSYRPKIFLLIADAHPRGLDQALLRKLAAPSPSVTSGYIDDFEKQGLVEVIPHPSDGRKNLLRLTRKGERRRQKVIDILSGADEHR